MASLLVALTGGIASGKSTVAKLLSEHGASVVDSDEVARQVVQPGHQGNQLIREEFGDEVFAGKDLDRSKLAEVVFADEQKRKKLEALLHPLIQAESKKLFESLEGIVIYQIPLLVESAGAYDFDLTITVEAEDQVRLKRLTELRGMSEREAFARIKTQASRGQRAAIADFVIDSDCSMDELRNQVSELWGKLIEIQEAKLGFS
jgi:dephospho-CoA kinase